MKENRICTTPVRCTETLLEMKRPGFSLWLDGRVQPRAVPGGFVCDDLTEVGWSG